jgi:hypothetical protein
MTSLTSKAGPLVGRPDGDEVLDGPFRKVVLIRRFEERLPRLFAEGQLFGIPIFRFATSGVRALQAAVCWLLRYAGGWRQRQTSL